MAETRTPLREAVNVADAMARDRIVRRLKKIRADAVLDKHTYERWNRLHPQEQAISTVVEDAIIAWCDGTGPQPTPYYCMACPEIFLSGPAANAHHDATGHNQHWKASRGYIAPSPTPETET